MGAAKEYHPKVGPNGDHYYSEMFAFVSVISDYLVDVVEWLLIDLTTLLDCNMESTRRGKFNINTRCKD